MPAKSKAELGWIFSNLGKNEGMKWAHDTPDIKGLPYKVNKVEDMKNKIFGVK